MRAVGRYLVVKAIGNDPPSRDLTHIMAKPNRVPPSNLVSNGSIVGTTIPTLPSFGDCEIVQADNFNVYPVRNGSGKSVGMGTVKVPIALSVGTYIIEGRIYGRLDDKGEFSCEVSVPKGITTTKDGRLAFRAHAHGALARWSQWPRVYRAAYAAAIAPPKASTAADIAAGSAFKFSADDLTSPLRAIVDAGDDDDQLGDLELEALTAPQPA